MLKHTLQYPFKSSIILFKQDIIAAQSPLYSSKGYHHPKGEVFQILIY